jgi:hypothetical protein
VSAVSVRAELDRARASGDREAVYLATIRWEAAGARALVAIVREHVAGLIVMASANGARDARLYAVRQFGADLGCRAACDAMDSAGPDPLDRLRAFAAAAGWGVSEDGRLSTSVDVEAALIYGRMCALSAGDPWWARVDSAVDLVGFAQAEARAQATLAALVGGESRG